MFGSLFGVFLSLIVGVQALCACLQVNGDVFQSISVGEAPSVMEGHSGHCADEAPAQSSECAHCDQLTAQAAATFLDLSRTVVGAHAVVEVASKAHSAGLPSSSQSIRRLKYAHGPPQPTPIKLKVRFLN